MATKISESTASHRITLAPEAGSGKLRSRYLELSVDATLELFRDTLLSAPVAAPPYQLLITVSATGELTTSVLSTSPTQPGLLSPTNQDQSDSSASQFQRWTTAHEILHDKSSKSESQPSRYPIRQQLISKIESAYTLLVSAEPALIRAVSQSLSENAERLNKILLEAVRAWTADERYRRLQDEDR